MSDLVRCDKCGCEIPERVNKKKKMFGLLTETWEEKHYTYMWNDDLWSNHTYDGKKSFHLCWNCANALKDWLNSSNRCKDI